VADRGLLRALSGVRILANGQGMVWAPSQEPSFDPQFRDLVHENYTGLAAGPLTEGSNRADTGPEALASPVPALQARGEDIGV
jgi:hypothetical protein